MYHKQLDLDTVIKTCKKNFKQIIIIWFSCFLLSCFIVSFIPKKYTAYMVVSPVSHDLKDKDKVEKEDLNRNNITKDFEKFVYLLDSSTVADKLAKDKRITKHISPSFSLLSLILYNKIKSNDEKETIRKYLHKNMDIISVRNSSMKQIILKHKNDKFAKYLLNKIYKTADEAIKNKEKIKNSKEISFINESLKNNSISENRENFIKLLQHQLQIQTMLNVDLPYSADIVEESNVSSTPNSPSIPLLITISTILLGGFFSCLFIYIKENK